MTTTRSIGQSAEKKLRRLYHQAWKRDWPEDKAYLTTLWNETKRAGIALADRYDETLVLMRESHEFEVQS